MRTSHTSRVAMHTELFETGVQARDLHRLHNEYDPISSMRRVTIFGYVQNPPKCDKLEHPAGVLDEWLAKKRPYEEFSNRDGSPGRVQDGSLTAAMYKFVLQSLEETP